MTTWTVGSTFNTGSLAGWGTNWPLSDGALSWTGGTASTVLSNRTVKGDVHIEADLRLGIGGTAVGLVVAPRVVAWIDRTRQQFVAWIDRTRQQFVVSTPTGEVTAALPASFSYTTWHVVTVERRGTRLTASVSADRLLDAVATVTAQSGVARAGRIGAASKGGATYADNITAAPLYQPVTTRVDDPALGAALPAYSDDFTGTGRPETDDPAWTWVRGGSATATESGGALVWPTQAAELYTTTNTASVLLRPAPACDFVVETKLDFDGTRGNQQAGILLYQNDDRYFKLAHSVLPLANGGGAVLQQTEFGKEAERPTANPPQAVANGPMFGGPAAATMWLRLRYTYDSANNEDEVREASSVDGATWTWGGTWTVPHTGALRIGLVSMNARGATAAFDYVHTYATPSGGC